MSRPPILLIDVAARCRAVGENLQIYAVEGATIFRVNVGGRELKIAVTLPGRNLPDLGHDPHACVHHAQTRTGLDNFLSQFTEDDALPFGPARRDP